MQLNFDRSVYLQLLIICFCFVNELLECEIKLDQCILYADFELDVSHDENHFRVEASYSTRPLRAIRQYVVLGDMIYRTRGRYVAPPTRTSFHIYYEGSAYVEFAWRIKSRAINLVASCALIMWHYFLSCGRV